jgi:hypothetical protein
MRRVLVAFLVAVAVVPAFAEFSDGFAMYNGWEAVQKINNNQQTQALYLTATYYLGYVSAVYDVISDSKYFDFGANVSVKQLTAIVGKWLENNLTRLAEPAVDLIYAALEEAFGID